VSDFDALLKRSFAEAHEPADHGFSANVAHAVARSEKALQIRNVIQSAGMALGGAAALYGVYAFVGAFGQEFLATAGLEVARIHGSLSAAPSVGDATGDAVGATGGLLQSLGAGLTQVLLVAGALAAGAVAYRAAQQD
jgi:hypothetical protein